MMSRSQIFKALFALASTTAAGAPAFRTKSRVVQLFSDVAPGSQPAFFQSEGKQEAIVTSPGAGRKWRLHAELSVYAHQDSTPGNGDVVDLLNDLVDGIAAALEPLPGLDHQTLGGLVVDCRIEGTIDTSEGRLGRQAVAVIPIVIIAT